MKESVKRITSGIIFMIVVVTVLALNNEIVDSIFVTLLSLCGIYEYNKCFKTKGYHPIPLVGYLSCLGILLVGAPIDFAIKVNLLIIALPILLTVMFGYIIYKKLEVSIVDLSITAFSIMLIPFMFSFMKLLMMLEHGRVWMILAFASSICTDTMAYEIGSRWGKHKLSVVSPKKSIEGSIAGIVGSVIACIVVALIANTYFATNINIIIMAVAGIIFSIVGQIGDLAASSVKRYCGVKDFSQLMPGHGGILDRFDSILFISPIIYAIVYIMNLI